MKLGLSGVLTRYFITSPLTPLILLASLMVGGLALIALPREEEPQISVPMVDIQCRGTQPTYLPETIRLRGAHRVESVYFAAILWITLSWNWSCALAGAHTRSRLVARAAEISLRR